MPSYVTPSAADVEQGNHARRSFFASMMADAVNETPARIATNTNIADSPSPQRFPVRPIITENVDASYVSPDMLGSLPGRPYSAAAFDGEQGQAPSIHGNA